EPAGCWKHATAAEAIVHLGDTEDARNADRAEVVLESDNLSAFSSTRKQARVLSRELFGNANAFDDCFPIPKFVVFSGHMLDAPDRRTPRFPPSKENEVKELLEKQLAA